MSTEHNTHRSSIDRYALIHRELEYTISPDHLDERPHFTRLVLDLVEDNMGDHPHFDEIVGTLEQALSMMADDGDPSDVENLLRSAYSMLPAGREAAESARETYARLHGPDGLPEDLEVAMQADVEVSRETWDAIVVDARMQMDVRDKDPDTAFWDAVYEFVELVPNIVVEGEVMGPDDIVENGPEPVTDGGVIDEGPVPDPFYGVHRPALFAVPDWVVEAIAHRLHRLGKEATPEQVREFVQEYVDVRPHFETADGEQYLEAAVNSRVAELRDETDDA